MLIAGNYKRGYYNQSPNGTPNTLSLSSLTALSGILVFLSNLMAGMVIGGISFVFGMVVGYYPICQWYHIPVVLSGMWFLYCSLYLYRQPRM